MQSFLGKINFLCKFIFDYSKALKPIQEMVKKNVVYKLDKREKDVFSYIKKAIMEEPTLYNPYFSKYIFLYTFTSDTSLTILLM